MGKKGEMRMPFVDIFDKALEQNDDRPVKPRDYIYASELGQGFYDRYHSMMGREYTNPPNKIAIRKFKMGNLVEDYFKLVLYNAGLLLGEEERTINKDFQLHVSGRSDVRYGGKIDFKNLKFDDLSFLSFFNVLNNGLKEFAERFPNLKLEECLIEVKSCADYTFNRIIEQGHGQEHNVLQGFHYAYTKKLPLVLVYFDKNSGRITSFWVEHDDPYLLRLYKDDIEKMHYYISEGVIPEKEMPILFDGKKLSLNWKVQYSKYLSDYGFDTKEDFKAHYNKDVIAYNRVLKRFWDGDKMTDNNKGKLREMIKLGVQLPREIMAVLKPQKEGAETKTVTDYNYNSDTKEVEDREIEIETPVEPKEKLSALEKLKNISK